MQRLRRKAWIGLLAICLLIDFAGAWALLIGVAEDPSVPVGLTGMTAAQLQAQSPDGYRLADFAVRAGGMGLVVVGALLASILVCAFRQERQRAWWTLWVLPVWGLATVVLVLVIGVAPGSAPPWPMMSGTFVAVVAALLLLVTARQPQERPSHAADGRASCIRLHASKGREVSGHVRNVELVDLMVAGNAAQFVRPEVVEPRLGG